MLGGGRATSAESLERALELARSRWLASSMRAPAPPGGHPRRLSGQGELGARRRRLGVPAAHHHPGGPVHPHGGGLSRWLRVSSPSVGTPTTTGISTVSGQPDPHQAGTARRGAVVQAPSRRPDGSHLGRGPAARPGQRSKSSVQEPSLNDAKKYDETCTPNTTSCMRRRKFRPDQLEWVPTAPASTSQCRRPPPARPRPPPCRVKPRFRPPRPRLPTQRRPPRPCAPTAVPAT